MLRRPLQAAAVEHVRKTHGDRRRIRREDTDARYVHPAFVSGCRSHLDVPIGGIWMEQRQLVARKEGASKRGTRRWPRAEIDVELHDRRLRRRSLGREEEPE